jgi:cytidine deaminase
MTHRKIEIEFTEYSSLSQMGAEDRKLCEEAIDAMKGSYAPYSNYNVGAAVRLGDGTIVKGANQENAASPSGLCAERTAMFAANAAHPGVPMRSIAIAGGYKGVPGDEPCSPCGACRQVMAEYQMKAGAPMTVIMYGKKAIWKFRKVDDILPYIFDSYKPEM